MSSVKVEVIQISSQIVNKYVADYQRLTSLFKRIVSRSQARKNHSTEI